MERISIAGPWISKKEIKYVTDAVSNGWYDKASSYINRIEEDFSKYVGRKYAICLPSCTSAIHLALLALNVKPRDEVIVPDITWIASSAPISYVGASPVFSDIDPKSWCISPGSITKNITYKTKAIIIVDLYGNMPDMDEILEISHKYKIPIIEDAAQAIGAEYKGKKAGKFGEISVFSFHGTKTLCTGEGGMLVTDDSQIIERCDFLRDHGRQTGEKIFWNTEVAYKYKMSNIQAALGLAQLHRIVELISKKIQTFNWYKHRLENIEGISLNEVREDVLNTFWMVTIILDPKFRLQKEDMMNLLEQKNIGVRPFFYPLSSLPAYQNFKQIANAKLNNQNAYKISPYGINLPSNLKITEEQVEYVCNQIKKVLG